MQKVLAPKVAGTWNLHKMTADLEVDFFVMYSSATTCFGNPGQSSYVAANLYLDGLDLPETTDPYVVMREALKTLAASWT